MHISCVLFAFNGSPIQNLELVHTNRERKQKTKQKKNAEFEMHEKMKKSRSSVNAKLTHSKKFSSNYNTLCDGSKLFKS